jgi:hypothetical protein
MSGSPSAEYSVLRCARSSSISSAARLVGGDSSSRSDTCTPVAVAIAASWLTLGSRLPFSMSESWLPARPTRSPSWSSVSPAVVRKWRMRWPRVARSLMT